MAKIIYILTTDRPGKIVAKTHLQCVKKAISENVLKSSSGYSAFKGDIFEDLPFEDQPPDEYKISVVSVYDNTKVLEVDTADLAKLTEEESDLLLPVPTSKERYDLFRSRNVLGNAAALKLNDKVTIRFKAYTEIGVLKHKGKIEGKQGTFFGVLLKVPFGDSDGTVQGKRYFMARKNYAIFATVNMMEFQQNFNKKDIVNGTKMEEKSTLEDTTTRIQNMAEYYNLKVGMRVVAFSHDHKKDEKVFRGIIRFIGKTKGSEEVYCGIELDTPDGSGEGVYKGEWVFKCKKNHAMFTKADTIIKESDYTRDPGDEFVLLSHEKESLENVKSDRGKSATAKNKLDLKNQRLKRSDSQGDHQIALHEIQTNGAGDQLVQLTYLKNQQAEISTYDFKEPTPISNHQSVASHRRDIHSHVSQGPRSLPFYDNHFSVNNPEGIKKTPARDRKEAYLPNQRSQSDGFISKCEKLINGPPSYNEMYCNDKPVEMEHQMAGSDFARSHLEKSYDLTLQVDSVVEVSLNSVPHYGVIRWMGVPDGLKTSEPIVGLELEQPYEFGTDGSFKGKRYFSCPAGRGFFVKLSNCKRDARFSHSLQTHVPRISEQIVEELPGIYLPAETMEDVPIGQMRGIQGHHNSCYLDSTLFAMFAFSVVFDIILHRERRAGDLQEYDEVRRVLKEAIVNPLRSKGFVNASSVLQLRKWLDRLGSVQGFMNEEKDPEEFLMLLFRDVLKVDPFIRLRTDNDVIEKTYCYQIWVEKDEYNPLPSLQYLIEQSFLTGNLRLEEVPSVFIVQLPRFGMQKIYKRIRLNSHLNISKVMSSANYFCLMCEQKASVYCRDCCHSFGWANPFVYLCTGCANTVHQHSDRRSHQPKALKDPSSRSVQDSEINTLELFAIVCIKTSHYVTFTKCGEEPNERWVFFDSMADRRGGQNGHNVPEVVECPEVKQWFNEKPLRFTESDSKNAPEKILRLFEDASLCFYRSNDLSIYK